MTAREGLLADERQATAPNTKPLLSILIPVFNAETWLEECVASIFDQQPELSFEVLLLDDCSTDGSKAIGKQLRARHCQHLSLLEHDRNRGIAATRNALIDAATGEYIWFLDSDDTLIAPSLSRLFEILNLHNPDICVCDFSEKDGQSVRVFDGPEYRLEHDAEALIRGVFSTRKLHFWTKIFRRSLWAQEISCPVGKVYEDIAAVPWLLLRASSYYYAPEPWLSYRKHQASIMAAISRSSDFAKVQNDDLASALDGFKQGMTERLGAVSDATNFAIAHFVAKEFSKICHRLLRGRLFRQRWSSSRAMLGEYRKVMEAVSPIQFDDLLRDYRMRRRYVSYAILKFCCCISPSAKIKTPDARNNTEGNHR